MSGQVTLSYSGVVLIVVKVSFFQMFFIVSLNFEKVQENQGYGVYCLRYHL